MIWIYLHQQIKTWFGMAILAIALAGCQTTPEAENRIAVDLDTWQESFDLTQLIDTSFYDIIPLETDSTCLIGEISDLFFDGNHFYVVDKISGSIFGFDRQGKFLFKIHQLGRGSGEYADLTSVCFTGERFYIYDPSLEKLLTFDAQGHFMEEHNVPGIWAFDIFVFHDRIYYWNEWESTNQGCYLLYSTDLQGGNLQKMLPFPEKESRSGWTECSPFYSLTDERAAVIYSSNDTLYCLDSKGRMQKYYFDFGKYKMPAAYARKSAIELLKLKAFDKYTSGLNGIWETKNYFFAEIMNPERCLVFNKETQEMSVVKRLDLSVFVGLGPWFCRHGHLICYHPSYTLIGAYDAYKNSDTPANYKSLLQEKVGNLNENDNPVLFLYKLKSNEY